MNDMIEVVENSGNRGSHAVVGLVTRTKYGRKKHGDRFMMAVVDQRKQPRLYIPVGKPVTEQRAVVQRPSPPRVVMQPPPPPPPPVMRKVVGDVVEDVVEEVVEEDVELVKGPNSYM